MNFNGAGLNSIFWSPWHCAGSATMYAFIGSNLERFQEVLYNPDDLDWDLETPGPVQGIKSLSVNN